MEVKVERREKEAGIMDIFDFMYEPITFGKNKPIKLFEAFSGIGTQSLALKYLGIKVEHIGISEVDHHAIKSYRAITEMSKTMGELVVLINYHLVLILQLGVFHVKIFHWLESKKEWKMERVQIMVMYF